MSRVRSVSQNDLLESLREGITEKSIVCDRELVGVRKGGGGAGRKSSRDARSASRERSRDKSSGYTL